MCSSHMLYMRPLSTPMLFWKQFTEGRRPIGLGTRAHSYIPRNVMNAVYWQQGSSEGIWKSPEVKSAMAKRADRWLPIRSIISFMLGIWLPSFEITLLRLQKSTVNRHLFVGLRTRWTCDHAVARDGWITWSSNKSSIIWFSVACFSTEICREGGWFADASQLTYWL